MLSSFRQIRRKWLENTSVRKYVFYALGEVILVVLGILIALQVNNWNERRIADIRVAQYLQNLRETLQDDINALDNTISVNRFRLNGIFYLLRNAGLNYTEFTEMQWAAYAQNDELHNLWKGPYPEGPDREFAHLAFCWLGRGFGGASFNYSVINELYSTGSFSDINDPVLKQGIGDYYRFLHQRLEGYAIEEHEQWANEVTRFLRDSCGIFSLDVSDIDDPLARIQGRKDVERQLRYLALEVNYHCIWSQQARSMAADLVQSLDARIEKSAN